MKKRTNEKLKTVVLFLVGWLVLAPHFVWRKPNEIYISKTKSTEKLAIIIIIIIIVNRWCSTLELIWTKKVFPFTVTRQFVCFLVVFIFHFWLAYNVNKIWKEPKMLQENGKWAINIVFVAIMWSFIICCHLYLRLCPSPLSHLRCGLSVIYMLMTS